MPRKLVLIAVLTAALVVSGRAQQPSSLANLKTTAEASDFKSTSTYDDVVKFMKAVDAASPIVFYTTYGTTYEGRDDAAGRRRHRASRTRAPAAVQGHGQAARPHPGATSTPARSRARKSAQMLLREFAHGPARRLAAVDGVPDHADLQRRRQREVRAQQPRPAERPDQRPGHARERPEPEHQSRLHEARDAGGPGVREAVERLRPAGRLRSAHV